jgi:hypothetical protein
MKWASHHLIADRLYDELIHPEFQKYHETLRNGSIYPDKQKQKRPHHYDCEDDIEEHIRKARSLRLNDQPEKAIFNLGVALHYIQDKWTAVDGSHPRHEDYEELLTKSQILPLDSDLSTYFPVLSMGAFEEYEWLHNNISKTPPYHEHILHIIEQPKPFESNAILDLNTAYRLSYRATEIVLQPKKNSKAETLIMELADRTQKLVNMKDNEEREKLRNLRSKCDNLRNEKGVFNSIRRIYTELVLGRAEQAYKKKEHLNKILAYYTNQYNEISSMYSDWYLVSPLPCVQTQEENQPVFDSAKKIQQMKSYSVEKIRQKYPNAYRTWTKREDKELIDEYKRGIKINEIAEIHGRKRGAITSRLKKHGIIN